MSAHLFIVYFSAISAITPPVAVAAYAAAGISEADPNATGVRGRQAWPSRPTSSPFVFMYRPALILDGPLPEILCTAVVATAAVYSFCQRNLKAITADACASRSGWRSWRLA